VEVVIIDPLMAALGGRVNTWKDQDMRRVLSPIAEVADRLGVTFIIVRHMNKKQGQRPVSRR